MSIVPLVTVPLECSVCCNNLNQTTRRLVICDFCPYNACLACTKVYILSTVHQPHCMSCRKEWNIDMMNKHFPKNFLRDDYRKMRECILFEEEKTYLPLLQEQAERQLSLIKYDKEIKRLQLIQSQNEMNEEQLVREQRATRRKLDMEISKNYNAMAVIRRVQLHRNNLGNNLLGQQPIKKFLMKCPIENCRGFLSEKYKCGLCNAQICKDCHIEIKEQRKEERKEENESSNTHVCDPNEVATIIELNKTTKPCPKCHARIFKTEGCDQMFCIQCHTAFSWKTGEIEQGIIHNPEYFRMLRAGNIQDPRHRQDHGGCGPMPNYITIVDLIRYCPLLEKKRFETYYQQFTHHRQVTLVYMIRLDNRDDDRIKYLTGEYDEKTFKQRTYVHYQYSLRKRDEQQILDSFVTIGEELFRLLTKLNTEDIMTQLDTLKDVTEKAFIDLDKKYQHAGYLRAKDLFRMFTKV